jgi:calpain-9
MKMLKIRNPWGNMEWRGTASDSDRRFWERVNIEEQMSLGYSNKDDGTFFMLWEDF